MTTLKTLDEAIALAMSVSGEASLAELEAVADQLLAFRDSTEFNNFDDDFQFSRALSKVSSRIINHADRPRRTEEQLRQARKGGKRPGVMSF
ncbi:hypothetical protein [Deinococcus sp.]|uniref:hypothetical protein n=1 Tax=Deinococcus sp. TaxID=47478 RepID=UPI003C7E7FE6